MLNFNTENKKANLAIFTIPDVWPNDGEFNLMTFRSEGQFNTIVYEDEDLYCGVEHRNVVFMNEKDITSNGFYEGGWMNVESEIGEMVVELIEVLIREGNVVMYYLEANAIVLARLDLQSKTSAFKRMAVRITKAV